MSTVLHRPRSTSDTPAAGGVAEERLDALLERQRSYFRSGATRPREAREERLAALQGAILRYERAILEASRADLGRGEVEAHASEVSFPLAEIRHALRSLQRWMAPTHAVPRLVNLPAVASAQLRPRGCNLIVSPWNYPFLLTLGPLVSCVAAGNVAIVKPSELAPASSDVLAQLLGEVFPEEHVAVCLGGVETSQRLLARRFDHIFFTGSTKVGRIVARAAAEHLCPTTLELGGKSPTIVMPSADLEVAARRIVLGRYVNAGQSCVAPDYVLVHRTVRDELLDRLARTLRDFYGPDASQSPDYGRIVNETHFDRLMNHLRCGRIYAGGRHDRASRYIEPTLLVDVGLDDLVMQEEIFGPILPVLPFDRVEEVEAIVERNPNPLALYLFTGDRADEARVFDRIRFGSGCINTAVLHFLDNALPLGGVGESGMGVCHGKAGFEAFSHRQGTLRATNFLDLDLRYPPYTEAKRKLIRRIL